jgi:hypothetical protein
LKSLVISLSAFQPHPERLITITRGDGIVYRLAEGQLPITIGGNTWMPDVVTIQAIKHTIDGSVPSTAIEAVLKTGGPFDSVDVDRGMFKNALVQIYVVDRGSPALADAYFTGRIGDTTYGSPQSLTFTVRGATAKAKGNMMEHFQAMCRTDLGSTLCKVPIWPVGGTHYTMIARSTPYPLGHFVRVNVDGGSTPASFAERVFEVATAGTTASSQPSYNTTIGATTTDGSCVLTARDSFTRYGQVVSITDQGHGIVINRDPDPRAVDGWFQQGLIYFRSGYLFGQAEVIANWNQAAKKLTTFMNMGNGALVAGDWIEFNRGCDLRKVTCDQVFHNSKNRRSEDDFLGVDLLTATSPTSAGSANPLPTSLPPLDYLRLLVQ